MPGNRKIFQLTVFLNNKIDNAFRLNSRLEGIFVFKHRYRKGK
jgi:hypothetical protein